MIFDYFYNDQVYKTAYVESKNKIGQQLKEYKKQELPILCDIQPIEEKAITYTWGNDIKSNFQMYCDELFMVDDVIIYNNKTYSIEKVIDWGDYKLYAIMSVDVVVLP
ncbi:hypothetical protein [Inconstantimicrobium mannanitabidum]|uniref:Uncharacterized protein n=1 Tax=Inconstantimicrobium mannanitabidum TaxID=1604901 RepID=A0ACB5RA01_9CLOT|nr:hypothetical protein [Clostridium sp. TW13]GKX65833.1 hypothetical protein rsdtw13_10910 [Clostridium sp. TW13]